MQAGFGFLRGLTSCKKEEGKKMKKVVKRLGKDEVERLLAVTVTVPSLSEKAMEEDDEQDVWEREVLLRGNRTLRESAMSRILSAPSLRPRATSTTTWIVVNE
uniref:Uncharacterized protein n=1 Tax=Leersia perrieri TaxID=77586 RepID=A0A0D9XNK3_9ORYZ